MGALKKTNSHTTSSAANAARTPQPIARIVSRAPVKKYDPDDPNAPKPTPDQRKLAGTYRVIHGSLCIPNPEYSETNTNAPKFIYAKPGDVVQLGDFDAAQGLDNNTIEEMDAKPSRVNKVWTPPAVVRNKNVPA